MEVIENKCFPENFIINWNSWLNSWKLNFLTTTNNHVDTKEITIRIKRPNNYGYNFLINKLGIFLRFLFSIN